MPEEKPFPQMKAGEPPSMIDAEVANPVLDLCAAMNSLTIIPTGMGTLKISGRTAVLDLHGVSQAAGDIDVVLCVDGELHSFTLVGTDNGPI